MGVTVLTTKQMNFIRKNYKRFSANEMDKMFGLTKGRVKYFMKMNGLKISSKLRYKRLAEKNRKRTTSTPAVDKFLKKNYLTINVNQLSIKIKRSKTFVKTRLRQLGLVIPRHIIEQRIKDARIQPGNVPKNKGKKQTEYMSKEAIEKTKATRFKKGEIAPNKIHYKDGDITIRHNHPERGGKPHKYIRISLRVWKELQIYNWEKKNGPVPKGHVLACKDGNTLNCKPSNWYPLSKVENMRRNSASLHLTDGYVAQTIVGKNGSHLYDEVLKNPDIIESKRTQLQLNRTIKKAINEKEREQRECA